MNFKTIILIINFIWGLPSSYFRSKFRKMVYQTDSWLINIKPVFWKEIKALVGNIYPDSEEYIKLRNFYRFYVVVQLILLLLLILV